MSIKQINDNIYALIMALADNYGFDADEALELVTDGDVNHVEGLHKLLAEKKKPVPKAKAEAPVEAQAEPSEEVKKARHNIDLWEKKLTAGDFKDREAHVKKLEAEKKKLHKLLGTNSEEKSAAGPPPKTAKVAPAPKPAPKEEVEKRIKRFSPAMTVQLGAALTKVKLSTTDKLKKEFSLYIEELSIDDFRGSSLADHMRNFAESKLPTAGGGGASSKKPEDESSDEDAPAPAYTTIFEDESAKEEAVVLKVEELAKLKMLVATTVPEVLWDASAKRHVKGPPMDEDEDMTEVPFKGKTYVVGDKTGRVYEATEGASDIFAGFKGVGLFKTMS